MRQKKLRMKRTRLNVEPIVGKNPVSREDGKVLYDKIKKLWEDSDQITVDFDNLIVASVSFMDEAFGHLALEHPREELKTKLRFVGMNEYDRALLNDIILSRVRQRNVGAHRARPAKRSLKSEPRLKRTASR